MGTLWVEKQHGRDSALRMLEADRAALALAEPASPGQSPGQPLAHAISPVYYRTKAAYVLWMLRDLAGDPALSAALKGTGLSPYINAKESTGIGRDGFQPVHSSPEGSSSGNSSTNSANPVNGNSVVRSPFEKLLEASEAHPDLAWFFADWVDADKGLPDLTIEGVFPTSASAGNWLVAVHVANAGYASAEVPVTVRSGTGSDARSVTQRVRVPARGKTIHAHPHPGQAHRGPGQRRRRPRNPGQHPHHQARRPRTSLARLQPIQPAEAVRWVFHV